jgi:hypothetical protein
MPPTLRKFLIAAPMTLMFSVACWGQTTVIEGDVKGDDGKLLPNAVIKIDRKDIKGSYKTRTDKKGHYFYGGLPIGTYKVTIEVDGKERDATDGVGTHLSASATVNFDLAAAAARGGGKGAPEQGRSRPAEPKDANEQETKEPTA